MIRSLGRFTLLVHDYDEAIEFYCGSLGFEPLVDQTTAGGRRFVHLGVPGQPGEPPVGLWLLKAEDEAQRALVGRQAGGQPLLVLYTDDCAATAAELEERGVRFRRPVRTDDGATFTHLLDLYGNEIVLVELGEEPG